MKMLTIDKFQELKNWVRRNARQLELTLWQYEFENGSAEAVLDALAIYQNEDGGFGNTLEPDNWNPNSTPYTTAYAIGILNAVGLTDKEHPIIKGILRFLDSGSYWSEFGWQFTIPTNDDYPCAIWWAYKSGDEFDEPSTTAELVSFILEFAPTDTPLYEKAINLVQVLTGIIKDGNMVGDGGAYGFAMLLEVLEKLGLAEQFKVEFLSELVHTKLNNAIVKDPEKWSEYGLRPSCLNYS